MAHLPHVKYKLPQVKYVHDFCVSDVLACMWFGYETTQHTWFMLTSQFAYLDTQDCLIHFVFVQVSLNIYFLGGGFENGLRLLLGDSDPWCVLWYLEDLVTCSSYIQSVW